MGILEGRTLQYREEHVQRDPEGGEFLMCLRNNKEVLLNL